MRASTDSTNASTRLNVGSTDKRFDELKDDYMNRFDDLKSASHKDSLEILRAMTALHERVAVVETRQNV